ncbi:SpoIIE family protein phosphatase [Nocardioidaceae bacterium]|nr:SpoIIE family protein phosphatase [Nocardioidaceae bacterium]
MTLPPSPHAPAHPGVDLSSCENEPIHIPGAVQPHGVLLALDPVDMRVVMASQNTDDMLGMPVDRAIGADVVDLIGTGLADQIRHHVAQGLLAESLVVVLGPMPRSDGTELRGRLTGCEVDVSVHEADGLLVVELEEFGRPRSVLLSYQSARGAMDRLSSAPDIEELARRLAVEVRDLTLFDRVMVYRFDAEWNGEVVAETAREDLEPFLGLRYPASDIPAQARRLYTVNWTRLIADVDYEPVPVDPLVGPRTGRPLDMSRSSLRSVSPVHLEYLRNMGVTASMSVSLVHNDRLWGLVACHHYSGPHRPSQDARAAAEFLGQVASGEFAERESAASRIDMLEASSVLSRITSRLARDPRSLSAAMVEDPEILALVGASGVACLSEGALRTAGEVPDDEVLLDLGEQLCALAEAGRQDGAEQFAPVATDNLVSLVDTVGDVAAGALLINPGPGWWLMWLRPPYVREVTWAGNPALSKTPTQAEDGSVRLSPRKSFEQWSELVRDRSEPWSSTAMDIAESLQTHLVSVMLKRSREQVMVAQSLQQSVVAEWSSQLRGLDVAVRYTPATSYQLGGDWWDLVDLDGDRVALVIGDVAGHGVSAVAAMTQVRAALRAYLFAGIDVAEAFDHLDRLMARTFDARVASACAVVLDRGTRMARIVNAGHPPPVICGQIELPSLKQLISRPVLGLGMGTTTPLDVRLPEGASMVLYTDGLVERRGEDLLRNIERLRATACAGPGGRDLESWLETLVEVNPGETDDDTTVVAFAL